MALLALQLKHPLTVARVLAAVEADESTGFCLRCGADRDGVEPDAERYECEECGARMVMGAEQVLILYGDML